MTASLLYQTFVVSSQLTATSLAAAIVSGVLRTQQGSCVFDVQGLYTGLVDADYRVRISTAGVGGDLAGAFVEWSDNGGGTWSVPLAVTPAVWQTLSYGIQIRLTAGLALPYVVFGDTWSFRAIREWGFPALTDWNRNTELRSDVVADGATWYLSTTEPIEEIPQACVLWDQNVLATTNVRVQSSVTSDFAALSYNQLLPDASPHIVHFLTGASANHYWRLSITAGTGQGDIRLSEWYLGHRVTVQPYDIGFQRSLRRLGSGSLNGDRLPYGQAVATPTYETYEVTYGRVQDAVGEGYRTLKTAWETMNDARSGDLRPHYLLVDDADLAGVVLVHWANDFEADHSYLDRYHVRASLVGLTRSLD